tara:strand:+ start:692 stop:1039 length:348 start_codon:yes stop_codon:yes gene_type:complete
MPRPNKTEENLKTIISFLKESQDIGRPKVSTMKLEKSVSGSKDNSFHDHNYSKWYRKRKAVERKISDLAKFCMKQINEDFIKTPTKQCKRKGCPITNVRVEIDTRFCSGCGRKYD